MVINSFRIVATIFALFYLTSCVNTKKVVYFNNETDVEFLKSEANNEPIIQKNDILSISVSSLNANASQLFNTPNNSAIQNGGNSGVITPVGYLVDQEGNLQFPYLGNVKAAGLTKSELKEKITKGLLSEDLLVDPIVNVRFLNFKVSVLGEVARPSVLSVANEKINVLEALSLAGDLTIYAQRDKVWLIREEGGKQILRRLNLNSNEVFTSPYYNLQSNDVLYVEPNKAKVASVSRSTQWLPVVFSATSVVIIALDRLLR